MGLTLIIIVFPGFQRRVTSAEGDDRVGLSRVSFVTTSSSGFWSV